MELLTVAELKKLAKNNKIHGYSKMKKNELIGALKDINYSVEHVSDIVRVNPDQEQVDVEKPSIEFKAQDCINQPRNIIVDQAKKLGIKIARKTKAQLCNEIETAKLNSGIVLVEVDQEPYQEQELDQEQVDVEKPIVTNTITQISLEEEKWLNIVSDLTGECLNISPDQLAGLVGKNELFKYAKDYCGFQNISQMSAIDIATALYDTTKLPGVESIIDENIIDKTVANKLISDINDNIDPIVVGDTVNEIINLNPAVNELEVAPIVIDTVKRPIVRQVIDEALDNKIITEDEAVNVLSDIANIESEIEYEQPEELEPGPEEYEQPEEFEPELEYKPEELEPELEYEPEEYEQPEEEIRRISIKPLTQKKKEDIEHMLRKLREPQARLSELAGIQTRVFQLLGLM